MKTINLTPFLLLILVFSSCAFHNGSFNSNVALSNNQFRVVGIAKGTASTTHVLGLGGLAKDALVYEARRDLYSKYPLAKGMVLANVTVDFKNSYFLIFAHSTLVTISADIIDFNPIHLDYPYQGFFTDDSTFFPTQKLPLLTNKQSNLSNNLEYIEIGSNVLFKLKGSKQKAIVIAKNSFGIKCEYQTDNGTKRIYLKPEYLEVIK